MDNSKSPVEVSYSNNSFDGTKIESTKNSIKYFSGKQFRTDIHAEGDALQIIKGAMNGDRKSLIMFGLMIILFFFSIVLPLIIGTFFLLMGEKMGYIGIIFSFIAFITILRNFYASYKRNKINS